MGSVEGSTLLPKIASFMLMIALLFHLIAIGAPWWSVSNLQKTERAEHVGLWKYCSSPIGDKYEACWDFVDIITGGMCTLCPIDLRKLLIFLPTQCYANGGTNYGPMSVYVCLSVRIRCSLKWMDGLIWFLA